MVVYILCVLVINSPAPASPSSSSCSKKRNVEIHPELGADICQHGMCPTCPRKFPNKIGSMIVNLLILLWSALCTKGHNKHMLEEFEIKNMKAEHTSSDHRLQSHFLVFQGQKFCRVQRFCLFLSNKLQLGTEIWRPRIKGGNRQPPIYS